MLENDDLKKALSAVEKHLEATISMLIFIQYIFLFFNSSERLNILVIWRFQRPLWSNQDLTIIVLKKIRRGDPN